MINQWIKVSYHMDVVERMSPDKLKRLQFLAKKIDNSKEKSTNVLSDQEKKEYEDLVNEYHEHEKSSINYWHEIGKI